MELINDKRLTSTMKRIRSGSTMLFREKNLMGNTFIDARNADLTLNHSTNKAMYADLIDEKWYWVNGCSHCDSSQSPYVVCDEHDKCISCKRPRSEFKEAVWGCHNNTWRCNNCQEAIDAIAKQQALERVAQKVEESGEYDKWEYCNQDNIKCPHCATEIEPCTADGVPEGKETCDICGGKYEIEPDYSITYSTTVVGERLTPENC